jgi:hypothetical protein
MQLLRVPLGLPDGSKLVVVGWQSIFSMAGVTRGGPAYIGVIYYCDLRVSEEMAARAVNDKIIGPVYPI